MLRRLAGRSHEVMTGIAVAWQGEVTSEVTRTRVWMAPFSEEAVAEYVATGEPVDKAGSYGIQGWGSALVERIDGDFFSVMGLPVRLVLRLLAEAGYQYRFGRET